MDSERNWEGEEEELDSVLKELGESDGDDLEGFSIKDGDDSEDEDDDDDEDDEDEKISEDGLSDEEEGIF